MLPLTSQGCLTQVSAVWGMCVVGSVWSRANVNAARCACCWEAVVFRPAVLAAPARAAAARAA